MDKVAVLEEIQMQAFDDELDKIAAKMPDLGKAVSGIKNMYAKSYKGLSKNVADALENIGYASKPLRKRQFNLSREAYMGSAGRSAARAASEGAPVLITGGALGAGGVGTGIALSKKK